MIEPGRSIEPKIPGHTYETVKKVNKELVHYVARDHFDFFVNVVGLRWPQNAELNITDIAPHITKIICCILTFSDFYSVIKR